MDAIEIISEPEAVITEDGYLFFRLPDGRYVDNPDNTDLAYDSLAQIIETCDILSPAKTATRLAGYFGWSTEELAHAHKTLTFQYRNENAVQLKNGREIRWPASPQTCTYVRVVQAGFELGYWACDDEHHWFEDVMGAVLACCARTPKADRSKLASTKRHAIWNAFQNVLVRKIRHNGDNSFSRSLYGE